MLVAIAPPEPLLVLFNAINAPRKTNCMAKLGPKRNKYGSEFDRDARANRTERLSRHCHQARFRLNAARARPIGPVAQWLEPAAHNGLVAGSSPARPTIVPFIPCFHCGFGGNSRTMRHRCGTLRSRFGLCAAANDRRSRLAAAV